MIIEENTTTINLAEQARQLTDYLHRGGKWRHFQDTGETGRRESLWIQVGEWFDPPMEWQSERNIYFTVNPSNPSEDLRKPWCAARNEHIEVINTLFAEVDGKDFVHKREWLPYYEIPDLDKLAASIRQDYESSGLDERTIQIKIKARQRGALVKAQSAAVEAAYREAPDTYKERALAHVHGMMPRPSVVCASGGGYQCYWLLRETIAVNDGNRAYVAHVQRAWVHLVGGDRGAVDLRRLLRFPGSKNLKPRYAPNFPTVDFEWFEFDCQYDFAELAAMIPPESKKPKTPKRRVHVPPGLPATIGDFGDVPTLPDGNPFIAAYNQTTDLHGSLLEIGYTDHSQGRMSRPGGDSGGVELKADNTACIYSYNDPLFCDGLHRITPAHVHCVYGFGGDVSAMLAALEEEFPVDTVGRYLHEYLTDLGNSRRFAKLYGQDVRYVNGWGFLVWNGKVWEKDQTGRVMQLAKRTALAIFDEANQCMKLAQEYQRRAKLAAEKDNTVDAAKATDQVVKLQARAKKLNAWAMNCQHVSRLDAMIKLAKSEAPIPARPEDFDQDQMLLNCPNGTIDLRTGRLRPHSRADLITKLCPVEYDPEATCPTWLNAMNTWMKSDQELISFHQRLFGYSITGDVSEQILPFHYGDGSNGKSTCINTQLAVLGKDYATQAAPDLLTAGRNAHPTELADLRGMRLVASIEVDDGKRMAESLAKQLTGGDKIKARLMRQDFFEFDPTHKIYLVANHKPVIKGTGYSIWRRILLIPFTARITEEEKDPKLGEKLLSELPGILAWGVQGCLEWQAHGLMVPATVRAATSEYQAESDRLGAFLAERTICATGKLQASRLYADYKQWCDENGDEPLNQTNFGLELKNRGYQKHQDTSSHRTYYVGIKLINHNPLAKNIYE